MKYRCIFFDIDGTLLDTEPIVMPELQATLLELTGKHYSLAELQRFWGIPTSDTAAALKLSDPGRFGRMWEERVVRRDGTSRIPPPCWKASAARAVRRRTLSSWAIRFMTPTAPSEQMSPSDSLSGVRIRFGISAPRITSPYPPKWRSVLMIAVHFRRFCARRWNFNSSGRRA